MNNFGVYLQPFVKSMALGWEELLGVLTINIRIMTS